MCQACGETFEGRPEQAPLENFAPVGSETGTTVFARDGVVFDSFADLTDDKKWVET